MVKISVLYPNGKDTRFNMDYYCSRHMPMVQRLLGVALKDNRISRVSAEAQTSRGEFY
jgi:uncharacterized protein (TIGR02118 family)